MFNIKSWKNSSIDGSTPKKTVSNEHQKPVLLNNVILEKKYVGILWRKIILDKGKKNYQKFLIKVIQQPKFFEWDLETNFDKSFIKAGKQKSRYYGSKDIAGMNNPNVRHLVKGQPKEKFHKQTFLN